MNPLFSLLNKFVPPAIFASLAFFILVFSSKSERSITSPSYVELTTTATLANPSHSSHTRRLQKEEVYDFLYYGYEGVPSLQKFQPEEIDEYFYEGDGGPSVQKFQPFFGTLKMEALEGPGAPVGLQGGAPDAAPPAGGGLEGLPQGAVAPAGGGLEGLPQGAVAPAGGGLEGLPQGEPLDGEQVEGPGEEADGFSSPPPNEPAIRVCPPTPRSPGGSLAFLLSRLSKLPPYNPNKWDKPGPPV
jgi:hypothetical protein